MASSSQVGVIGCRSTCPGLTGRGYWIRCQPKMGLAGKAKIPFAKYGHSMGYLALPSAHVWEGGPALNVVCFLRHWSSSND